MMTLLVSLVVVMNPKKNMLYVFVNGLTMKDNVVLRKCKRINLNMIIRKLESVCLNDHLAFLKEHLFCNRFALSVWFCWHYKPSANIEPYSIEEQLEFVFNKLFELNYGC